MKIIVILIKLWLKFKTWIWSLFHLFVDYFFQKTNWIKRDFYLFVKSSEDKLNPGYRIKSWQQECNKNDFNIQHEEVEDYFEKYRSNLFPDRPSRINAKFVYDNPEKCKKSAERGRKMSKLNLLYPNHSFYKIKVRGPIFETDFKYFQEASEALQDFLKNKINKLQLERVWNRCANLYWKGEHSLNAYPEIITQGNVEIISEVEIINEQKSGLQKKSRFSKKNRLHFKT